MDTRVQALVLFSFAPSACLLGSEIINPLCTLFVVGKLSSRTQGLRGKRWSQGLGWSGQAAADQRLSGAAVAGSICCSARVREQQQPALAR